MLLKYVKETSADHARNTTKTIMETEAAYLLSRTKGAVQKKREPDRKNKTH